MANERERIPADELLEGAERLIEQLQRDWPEEQYSNQHEVLLLAAYALIGPAGVRHSLDSY